MARDKSDYMETAQDQTGFSTIERWYKSEEAILRDKLSEAQKKPDELEKKLDSWLEMTEAQKRKKCLSKMRQTFTKPYRLLQRLRLIGDDIHAAIEEGVMVYRVHKILDLYIKQKNKLDEAVHTAVSMTEEFGEVSEQIGGFSWDENVPALRDDGGAIVLATTGGIKQVEFEI